MTPSDHRTPGCAPGRPRQLPIARGPRSAALLDALRRPRHTMAVPPAPRPVDAIGDEDLQLALYCCYELTYRGFDGVDDGWEHEPSLVLLRQGLEAAFEAQLRGIVPTPTVAPGDVGAELWAMTRAGGGPSVSAWALEHGTFAQAQELAVHRSAYQLKEADPHTWGLPRLHGRAKAAMVAIQVDEYGNGDAPSMHCSLFADAMRSLGLDDAYGAYLDLLPAETLATTNLISLFGLHRRLRGALVGHLASFEMNSVGPMGRYARWLRALGVDAAGRRFYDVHVEADEVHQHIAVDDLVGGLLEVEPGLAGDVLFGARALGSVEGRFAARVLAAWSQDAGSLLPRPTVAMALAS